MFQQTLLHHILAHLAYYHINCVTYSRLDFKISLNKTIAFVVVPGKKGVMFWLIIGQIGGGFSWPLWGAL